MRRYPLMTRRIAPAGPRLALGLIALIAALFVLGVPLSSCSGRSESPDGPASQDGSDERIAADDIPRPDLSGVEAGIANAVRVAQAAVESEPGSAEAWGALGDRYHLNGWFDEAAICYRSSGEIEPVEARWAVREGKNLLVSRDAQGAADAYARALGLDERYAPAHLGFANALVELGRVEEAGAHYSLASRLDPSGSHAELGLGQIALDGGELDTAREHLEEAVRRDPEHGTAHLRLSQAYFGLGDTEKAERHAALSRELPARKRGFDPVADPDAAPAGARGHVMEGQALERQGREEEALEQYLEAVRINPDWQPARLALGDLLARQGKLDEAAIQLAEAVRLESTDFLALEALASVRFRQGNSQEAARLLSRAIEINPERSRAHANLGRILWSDGEKEKALHHISESVRLDPANADRRFTLGMAMMELKRYPDAEQEFKTLLKLDSKDPQAHFGIAETLLARGRPADALVRYQQALTLASSDEHEKLAGMIRERIRIAQGPASGGG